MDIIYGRLVQCCTRISIYLADGFTYIDYIKAGIDIDEFASRLFFFNSHLDFFEEIANLGQDVFGLRG